MAVTKDEVKRLAELARIELTDEEAGKLVGEFDSILTYIDMIRKVKLPEVPTGSAHLDIENVMREDGEPHAPGAYSESMLAQAPAKSGKLWKVKKILG